MTRRTPRVVAAGTALLLAAGCSGPATSSSTTAVPATSSSAEPTSGGCQARIGALLDRNAQTAAEFIDATGENPDQFGDFLGFPLSADERHRLGVEADQAAAAGADLYLTIEPHEGLASVTRASAQEFAGVLAGLDDLTVYVRFGHEMNGGWYPWGQQPTEHVRAYRTVADAVHTQSPTSRMVWSPNYGGGYPFTGGEYVAEPGTVDFEVLDTNRDGYLTMADDMYAPYYPGDEYVDWVGLTLYWFGHEWPWGDNEIPDPGRFAGAVSGTWTGGVQDESAVPDFHQDYAVARGKPMAISETSALYVPDNPAGASEIDIKRAWLTQVMDPAVRTRFPQLCMVNWFEYLKDEPDNGGWIDWRISADPELAALHREAVQAFRTAPPAD